MAGQPSPQQVQTLTAFFADYCAALESIDLDRIATFWDTTSQHCVYLAEEMPDPFIGWPAIAEYWRGNARAMERMALKMGRFHFHALADHLITATYDLHWQAQMIGARRPVAGNVWASCVVNMAPRPHIVHYTETVLGPLPFLRRVYETAVSPDFLSPSSK
jgi:hypothetical protein